jgi:hypothetical protein
MPGRCKGAACWPASAPQESRRDVVAVSGDNSTLNDWKEGEDRA